MAKLTIQHVEIKVSSVARAKEFYVGKLGLPIIQEIPAINLLALRAGDVRISIFEGGDDQPEAVNRHLIFRTDDIEQTLVELESKGLVFADGIQEAPGFLRFTATHDEDGNRIEFAQYLRDPLS